MGTLDPTLFPLPTGGTSLRLTSPATRELYHQLRQILTNPAALEIIYYSLFILLLLHLIVFVLLTYFDNNRKCRWLTFWTYISLPTGALFGFSISSSSVLEGRIDAAAVIGISFLQLVVAIGLHRRELWAWRLNWSFIIMAYTEVVLFNLMEEYIDVMVQMTFKVVVGALIWIWPNYIYWTKRRALFQRQPQSS